MTDILNSILAINANAKCTVNGEDVNNVTWHDGTTPIAPADILAKQKELQTSYTDNVYQRNRLKEYPSIGDQLDLIYHAGVGGDAFQAAIKAIKDKHPKG